MDNARQLFQLWRNSGIDVTGGRYAIVARDPDSAWTAGLVKTRRLKAPTAGMGGGSSSRAGQSMRGNSNNMAASGRYGTSTGSSSMARSSIIKPQQERERVVSIGVVPEELS